MYDWTPSMSISMLRSEDIRAAEGRGFGLAGKVKLYAASRLAARRARAAWQGNRASGRRRRYAGQRRPRGLGRRPTFVVGTRTRPR